MARIDSLLSIVVQQGADELRLGTDREPKMLAGGAPRRLAVPRTSDETLRELLDDSLGPDRWGLLHGGGRVEFAHDAGELGTFRVVATPSSSGGFEIVFHRAQPRQATAASDAPLVSAIEPAAHIDRPRAATTLLAQDPVGSPGEGLAHLVAAAAAMGASDLHLAEGRPPIARIDGKLRQLGEMRADFRALVGRSPTAADALAGGGAVDIGLDVPGVGRVRMHVFVTAEGPAAAVRLWPGPAPSLASLRLPVSLDDVIHEPHGLVLIGGATGAGKSTTLAALAQEALKKRSIVLTTLEDPIEQVMTAPAQSILRRRQVGRDVRDFAGGLRDALREDPDVLLVGEMRDAETIGLALTAAETGHLVLSSIHCRSAASAVERIVDAYRPARDSFIRAQLADSLRVVVVQHLLPRARGGGRVPVVEVLRVTRAVAAMIREGKMAQIPTAIQSGKRDGMLSLERCLADRVLAGEVRLEDARAIANDPESFAMCVGKG